MSRRLLTTLLLVLFGFLFACTLLEGVVRLTKRTPPRAEPAFFWAEDKRFGWYHQPGAEGYYFNPPGEYNAWAKVNSAGLIDQEYTQAKPAGVYRILVLGDSFAEGLRLPMDASFHSLLERNLTVAGYDRVEVINGGVAGWGTDQQLLFYREVGRTYQPDLVLLSFFPTNDVMNNAIDLESENFGGVKKPYFRLEAGQLVLHNSPAGSEPQPKPAAPPPEPPPAPPAPLIFAQPALDHSALYRYLIPRLRTAAPEWVRRLVRWGLATPGAESSVAAQDPSYIPVAYGVYETPAPPAWETGWAMTQALLAELDHEIEQDGGRLVVVSLPAQEQVQSWVWQRILKTYPAMQARAYDVDQPQRRLATLAGELGIPDLDLLSDFRAWTGPDLFFTIDGHWNERGHALAEEKIREWLAGGG